MPTERGWAALGAGIAFFVLWWGFGEGELLAAALFLVGAFLVAWVLVRVARRPLVIARRLTPTTTYEGDVVSVTVSIGSIGGRSLWSVGFEDEVAGLGTARFVAGRLPAGETFTAGYRILARPRGLYRVGPVRVSVTDPLHLASSIRLAGNADRLVVYPSVEQLEGLPLVRGLNPALHATRPEFSHRGGEDFFTLREYRIGDDLRRVHWRSSAKRDELMIRQLETPWQSRALVLLDVRRSSYESRAAFEHAVSGAASALLHLRRHGFDCDLWAGPADVSGAVVDAHSRSMELLAVVDWVGDIDLRSLALRIRTDGAGGALVLVTGSADEDLAAVRQLLAPDFGATVLLSVTSVETTQMVQFHRAGTVTVVVPPDGSWATAWSSAIEATWSTAPAG
jgi:uncharacterized protein (DUF58 family)